MDEPSWFILFIKCTIPKHRKTCTCSKYFQFCNTFFYAIQSFNSWHCLRYRDLPYQTSLSWILHFRYSFWISWNIILVHFKYSAWKIYHIKRFKGPKSITIKVILDNFKSNLSSLHTYSSLVPVLSKTPILNPYKPWHWNWISKSINIEIMTYELPDLYFSDKWMVINWM